MICNWALLTLYYKLWHLVLVEPINKTTWLKAINCLFSSKNPQSGNWRETSACRKRPIWHHFHRLFHTHNAKPPRIVCKTLFNQIRTIIRIRTQIKDPARPCNLINHRFRPTSASGKTQGLHPIPRASDFFLALG